MLWGALVYASLGFVLPAASVKIMVLLAATLAAFVEFTQLLHWPWLDAFRGTPFGVLAARPIFIVVGIRELIGAELQAPALSIIFAGREIGAVLNQAVGSSAWDGETNPRYRKARRDGRVKPGHDNSVQCNLKRYR